MPSVTSASALITGVSLAVTATALMLNILDRREEFDLKSRKILFTALMIFISFYSSILYLAVAEFGGFLPNSGKYIFAFAAGSSATGIAYPLLSATGDVTDGFL